MPSSSSSVDAAASAAAPAAARRWRRWRALALVAVGIAVGMVAIVGLEDAHVAASSTEFCISCHSTMRDFVYEELKQSRHYTNPAGVRPSCGDCHVSHRVLHATFEHLLGAKDLYAQLTKDWSDPKVFESQRVHMAERARLHMLREDSHTCRECHKMEAIVPTRKRGERAHEDAIRKNRTNCIACHYNLVHKEAPLTPAFSEAIKAISVSR
jgi:nitrate/TMAO reductase-like tetraheme cytochrome c subunit